MQKLLHQFSQSNNPTSPGQYLRMLRLRSRLTQAQLADLLGLRSARMVRNWEGEFNLPSPQRLRRLIEIYLERQVFVAGEEIAEGYRLWQIIKEFFDAQSFDSTVYPVFDESWFSALLNDRPAQKIGHFSPADDPTPINNLPQLLSPLLGREGDLERLAEWLQNPARRLFTLSGTGGSGKTSLALALAKRVLNNFPDGVFFIRLENITGREMLLLEIGRTLLSGNLKDGQELLNNLKLHLNNKKLLLILDNFEQLAEAAGLLVELLGATAEFKVLVTSRISLQLSFEQEYPVGPLSLPDKKAALITSPEALVSDYPGIALFVERARSVRSDFNLTAENAPAVVEICRELDGLPLALELAAALVRTFTPQKLLERLRLDLLASGSSDLPVRQQTLRNTLTWSFALLNQGEQPLFARLSIFAGGCTLEAAEAVCNPQGDLAIEVLVGLDSILAKNLLKRWEGDDGETRYGMLVTIREFAREKLAQRGELETIYRNFLSYFTGRIRQLVAKPATKQSEIDRVIESEYTNLRVALDLALAEKQGEAALELSGALGLYWVGRGQLRDGLQLLEQALAVPGPVGKARANALLWFARLHNSQGDFTLARTIILEALDLFQKLGDKRGLAWALLTLGSITHNQAEYGEARGYFEQSLALSREINDYQVISRSLLNLGNINTLGADYVSARKYYEESLHLGREADDKRLIGTNLGGLGIVALQQGECAKSLQYYEQCRAMQQKLESGPDITGTLVRMGIIAVHQGEYARARQIFEEALLFEKRQDIPPSYAFVRQNLGWCLMMVGEFTEARQNLEEALALCNQFGFIILIAELRHCLGWLALLEGDFITARTFLTEALTLIRKHGFKIDLNWTLTAMGLVALNQFEEGEARTCFGECLSEALTQGDKMHLAMSLTGLAYLTVRQWKSAAQGDEEIPGKIARICGAIDEILVASKLVMFRPLPELYRECLVFAKANQETAEFEMAWAEGHCLLPEEALVLLG